MVKRREKIKANVRKLQLAYQLKDAYSKKSIRLRTMPTTMIKPEGLSSIETLDVKSRGMLENLEKRERKI